MITFINAVHVSHLRLDGTPYTACGEPWQGWQAPAEIYRDPRAVLVPPQEQPRPHVDLVRPCLACQRETRLKGLTR